MIENLNAKHFANDCRTKDYKDPPEDRFYKDISDDPEKPKMKFLTRDCVQWIAGNFFIEFIGEEIFVYAGKLWQPIKKQQLMGFISDLIPGCIDSIRARGEIFEMLRVTKIFAETENSKNSLNFENGVLADKDNTDSFISHDIPETNAGFFHFSIFNFRFDLKADPVRFKKYIYEMLEGRIESEAEAKIIQNFLGSTLADNCKQRCCLWLNGIVGKNGKGVMTNLLHYIFGSYCKACDLKEFEHRFGLWGAENLKLITVPEVSKKSSLDDSRFKALISGDYISVEQKRGEIKTISPKLKILACSNHLPYLTAVDMAMDARIRLIDLKNSFEGREDKELLEKLIKEAPGIFNWLHDGYDQLVYDKYNIGETEEMKISKAKWFNREDSVWLYMSELSWTDKSILKKMEKSAGNQYEWKIDAVSLWKDYQGFCSQEHIRTIPKRHNFNESVKSYLGCPDPEIGKEEGEYQCPDAEPGTGNRLEFKKIWKILEKKKIVTGFEVNDSIVKKRRKISESIKSVREVVLHEYSN